MDLQRENDLALNLAEDCRRQPRKGKGVKSSSLQTKQRTSSVEIEFQKACQDLQGNDKDHCTEKLIAGILGVICFILMYTLIRMILALATLNKNSSMPITKTEKAYPCGHCPLEWLTYSNSCYYISTENKTWNESLVACASKNSSLLHLDNEEESKFLNPLSEASWTGVFRRSSYHPWMFINGSTPTLQIAGSSSGNENCVMLQRHSLTSGSCESSKMYICKHKFYG